MNFLFLLTGIAAERTLSLQTAGFDAVFERDDSLAYTCIFIYIRPNRKLFRFKTQKSLKPERYSSVSVSRLRTSEPRVHAYGPCVRTYGLRKNKSIYIYHINH
jgi:hypothetical protein